MRLYAHLLLAVFVLNARAATIPEEIQPEIEKEISNDDIKSPVENISSEQETVDQTNTIKDVQNSLRNNVAEDIPVEIIVEEVQPALKINVEQENINEVSDEEIQRLVVDLKNPGPPQRQEHDSQNPSHYEDAERILTSVIKGAKDTQGFLRQSFQGVTDRPENWYVNNEQLNNMLVQLQENYTIQIQQLNNTLQNIIMNLNKPTINKNQQEVAQTKANFEQIELRLKTLQNNFNNGVKALSNGVQIVATLRDESAAASSEAPAPTTASPSPPLFPQNPFANFFEMMGNLQTSMVNGFANVTQAFNSYVTQNQNLNFPNIFQGSTTASPQSDTAPNGSSTTARPSPWQNIQASFNNFLTPNAPASTPGGQPAQTGLFSNIQNLPFIQNFNNLIQPNRPGAQSTEKSTEASTQANAAPAASSSTPAASSATSSEKSAETKPEAEKKPEETGPIRQLLEKNPVVQSITGAVQRIQNTINNPEKPRDTEIKDETGQEKGGVIFVSGHGHGGGSGDSNDSGSRVNADEVKETVPEEMLEEIIVTETVPEKTE